MYTSMPSLVFAISCQCDTQNAHRQIQVKAIYWPSYVAPHLNSRLLHITPAIYFWCQRINPLIPNDPYSGHIAPLTSKRCILYIYSTNTGTEYFKHGIYSPLFSLQNAVCFINLTYLVPVLFTFYIQGVPKFKK